MLFHLSFNGVKYFSSFCNIVIIVKNILRETMLTKGFQDDNHIVFVHDLTYCLEVQISLTLIHTFLNGFLSWWSRNIQDTGNSDCHYLGIKTTGLLALGTVVKICHQNKNYNEGNTPLTRAGLCFCIGTGGHR